MLFTDESTFVASDLILVSSACQIDGGLVGAAAIDRLGRKPVLQAGAWLCLLSNILLSLYFSTVDDHHNCPSRPGSVLCWTPAVATCIFFFGFGGGLGNIFFVLLGEVSWNNNFGLDNIFIVVGPRTVKLYCCTCSNFLPQHFAVPRHQDIHVLYKHCGDYSSLLHSGRFNRYIS